MVAAMNLALPAFCSDWVLPACVAEYVPKGSNTKYPTKLKIFLLDSAPPSAGILAYHSISGNTPYGNVYCSTVLSYRGTVLYSNNTSIPTIAQALCHEIFELLVDPVCNSWADNGTVAYAYEPCDPVESNLNQYVVSSGSNILAWNSVQGKFLSTPVTSTPVTLSDWILPAWFNIQGSGPYNHLKTLTKPFTLSRGGYAIILTPKSQTSLTAITFGEHVLPEKQKAILAKGRVLKRTT